MMLRTKRNQVKMAKIGHGTDREAIGAVFTKGSYN